MAFGEEPLATDWMKPKRRFALATVDEVCVAQDRLESIVRPNY